MLPDDLGPASASSLLPCGDEDVVDIGLNIALSDHAFSALSLCHIGGDCPALKVIR
jgi:hypothetical protein